MSVRDLRISQITGPVRLGQGGETRQAAYKAPEAAVLALGEAEIQRWRELVLANEPRLDYLRKHPSWHVTWVGILYNRAVLGVVAVGGPDGGTVEIPVAEYWAMQNAKGNSK